MDLIVREQFEKIAALVAYDVPQRQIANATGLSDARISEIIATEEFKAILQEKALENFEKHQTLNDGWDIAENLALNNVLAALEHAPDPDYSLKVAAMANKANRRGRFNQSAIPGQAGVRAVINLNAAFVNKLQQNFSISQLDHTQIKQKDADFLSPESVETMLVGGSASIAIEDNSSDANNDVDDLLPDFSVGVTADG